jgi:hypothetical protein
MSMMQLLSAGKSLVGLNDPGKRYRQSDPRAMPNFGSSKIFQAKAGAKAPSGTVTKLDQARSVTTGAAGAGAKKNDKAIRHRPDAAETPLRSGSLTPAFSSRSGAERSQVEKSRSGHWFSKMVSWIPRSGDTRKSSRVTRLAPAPVQGELSLEKVKVLCNDLSDADLEVVAVKQRPAQKPQEAVSSSRGGNSGGAKGWDRVAMFLGAGQT